MRTSITVGSKLGCGVKIFRWSNSFISARDKKSQSKAITGCFATPGIDCNGAFIAAHNSGVGDHRYHGQDFPKLIKPSGRNLQADNELMRDNYNKVLLQLTKHHRMFQKALHLQHNQDSMAPHSFQLQFNQWDKELTQYMHASEKRCRKKKNSQIPFSPIIGYWIRRMGIYCWIQSYRRGEVRDPRNLFRSCRRIALKILEY